MAFASALIAAAVFAPSVDPDFLPGFAGRSGRPRASVST